MTQLKKIAATINNAIKNGIQSFNEDRTKEIFKQLGLPVVQEIRIESMEDLHGAAQTIGYPVVLKGLAKLILHKTEASMVDMGITNEANLKKSAQRMKCLAGEDFEAFLIQPQIQGKREFTAGMFKDPQFGPVIMFGIGGVLTEALKDMVLRLAPLSGADIDDMLDNLKSKALLRSFRGEAAVNRAELKSVLRGLSDLAMACPGIREIDINPLIINPAGLPVAVDGLMILEKPESRDDHVHQEIDFKDLYNTFYPQTIAFIGASAVPGKWGHLLPTNAYAGEFNGEIFLINPKGGKIMGRDVYKTIDDLEGDVDLAMVTIPAGRVMELIPALEKKHVKGMVLITSGFREVGDQGRQLEDEIMAAAQKAGILVIGPNTMGLCNPHASLYASGANALPLPGSTAIISQSGNIGTQLLAFAEQQGISIRLFVGSGNEAMITTEDYMQTLEFDELTRTVVLYIESVEDGRRFFESAGRLSKTKPVVVLKGGRTQDGERAASSHTGAMASDAGVFNAACAQAGIIQVEQPMELLDMSTVFSSLPMPKGGRVAIMTLGGGWGVVTTDLCAEYGLDVPKLSEKIIERLNNCLPDFWSHGNPVDLVGDTDPEIPKICLEELLKWDGCDAVIHLGIHGRRILVNAMANAMLKTDPGITKKKTEKFMANLIKEEEIYIRHTAEMTQKYNKPVVGVSLLIDELSRTLYRYDDLGYKGVFFPSPERAVKALAGMVRYRKWRDSAGIHK
ncbi:acetate--CoA ligase family protein [Desulfobacter curvatus]|uniref:acetate--CoA ligase family protein n=1 Tax=Desulfobacter curvatus TaxID=2290 RepID=UPI0003695B01|nr:acetate--CoA ligase family protein [Desulfobacter curvatus]